MSGSVFANRDLAPLRSNHEAGWLRRAQVGSCSGVRYLNIVVSGAIGGDLARSKDGWKFQYFVRIKGAK
jgi:hypothetical protein